MIQYPIRKVTKEIEDLIERSEQKIKQLFYKLSQQFSDGQMVSYNDLNTFPILLRGMLGIGIHAKRLPLPPAGGIYFQVDFKKESELGPHKHDCYEHITVDRGAIIDLETGKIYEEGQEVMIKPDVIHNIKSLDHFTILYILFAKNDPY